MGRLIPTEAWWSCSWTSSGNTLDCWFRTKHGIHTSCRQLCDGMHCPRGCQSDYCEMTRFQVPSVISGTSGEAVALWLVICLGTREVYVLCDIYWNKQTSSDIYWNKQTPSDIYWNKQTSSDIYWNKQTSSDIY